MHYNSFVIGDPPAITGQPASSCTLAGNATRLAVVATGAQLNYQWYRDGEPLVDATTNAVEFPAIAAADAGTYQVVVSNPVGSATSSVATVTVLVPDTASYRSAVEAQPGLVSLYTFDDGEPADAVGVNDGTFVGTTAISAGIGGGGNQALALDATGHVALGPVPEFSFPGGDGTVEGLVRAAWVTDPPYAPCLFANRDGGPTRWSIHLLPNKVQLAFWNGAAVGIVAIPQAGTGWHHVASVFDAGSWRVYWDGQLVGVTATPLGVSTGLPTQLGSSSANATTEGWIGGLDEIAVYDTALSPGTIASHFAALAGPRLTITRAGTQILLSWPASAAGFVLESANQPGAAIWSPVADVAGNSVILPAAGAPAYFRLRKQ